MLVWLVARPQYERNDVKNDKCRKVLFPPATLVAGQQRRIYATTHIGQMENEARVLGIGLVEPQFVYDRYRKLNPLQQEMYDVWLKLSTNLFDGPSGYSRSLVGDWYYYSVSQAWALLPSVSAERLFGKRGRRLLWREVGEYAAPLFEGLPMKPDWLSQMPSRAVCLPYCWADLLSHGVGHDFALLDKWPSSARSIFGWNDAPEKISFDLDEWAAKKEFGVMTSDKHLEVANTFRGVGKNLTCAYEKQLVHRAVSAIDNARDRALRAQVRSQLDTSKVVQVLVADMLRNDSDMREVLKFAARILLPPHELQLVLETLQTQVVFDKARLSRSRFDIDCGLMLWNRDCIRTALSGRGSIFHVMTDSSPQFHRDYQITLTCSMRRDNLAKMAYAADTLHSSFDANGSIGQFTRGARVHEKTLKTMDAMEVIREAIRYHRLPATVLASGKTALAYKWQRMFWSMRLETHTHSELAQMVKSTLGYLSDGGTEKGVQRVEPVRSSKALPWFQDREVTVQATAEEDWPKDEDENTDDLLDFSGWLDVTGPAHIVHGITEGLGKAMQIFLF